MIKKLFVVVALCVVVSLVVVTIDGWNASDTSGDGPTVTTATYSNIHAEDYVGPDACVKCHGDYVEHWRGHSHSRMNQNASADTVLGDFDNAEVEYGEGRVLFETIAGQFFISMFNGEQLQRQYRVTRTVGSRFTQMYIGLQTKGPEPDDHSAYKVEGKLPFGYWMERKTWSPVSYFDSDYAPEATDLGLQTADLHKSQQESPWGLNCIYCHNTYPYQHRVFFGDGLGHPRDKFYFPQGMECIEQWGPATPDNLVTLGVSCESCHFGCRDHVETGEAPRYYPSSPQLQLLGMATAAKANPSGKRSVEQSQLINSTCSQCHCAHVTLYPNGAASWNSREALDFTSGACKQQMQCTDCHDPHRSMDSGGMLSTNHHTETCTQCHPQFADTEALREHTRHSEEVSCLDCHMPRIVQGLERVVRTHHISLPTDPTMLKYAAPNACNLCHLDKSAQWTIDELNQGWGKKITPRPSWNAPHGGDLDKPMGKVWLAHERPVVRLIATDAYARSSHRLAASPELVRMLDDPYAVNRMFGLFAIESKLGRRLTEVEYAPLAPHARRRKQLDALWKKLEVEGAR